MSSLLIGFNEGPAMNSIRPHRFDEGEILSGLSSAIMPRKTLLFF